MKELTQEHENEIREIVFDFFAEECDIPRERLSVTTDIIKELEGDSLMFLSLLEIVRKKYGLQIELKTLGKHLMKKPANTIGQVLELSKAIVKYGNDILSVEL